MLDTAAVVDLRVL
ncbi:hypothetical protein LINGRAHAP2_LOCUS7540 [Linum grandiflorum]